MCMKVFCQLPDPDLTQFTHTVFSDYFISLEYKKGAPIVTLHFVRRSRLDVFLMLYTFTWRDVVMGSHQPIHLPTHLRSDSWLLNCFYYIITLVLSTCGSDPIHLSTQPAVWSQRHTSEVSSCLRLTWLWRKHTDKQTHRQTFKHLAKDSKLCLLQFPL